MAHSCIFSSTHTGTNIVAGGRRRGLLKSKEKGNAKSVQQDRQREVCGALLEFSACLG